MPEWNFDVRNKSELETKLRDEVFALDNLGRGEEIYGNISVIYSEDDVKNSSLIPQLESRGITFSWRKRDS